MIWPQNFKLYPERPWYLLHPCGLLVFDMIQLVLFSTVERGGNIDPFNEHFWNILTQNKWKGTCFQKSRTGRNKAAVKGRRVGEWVYWKFLVNLGKARVRGAPGRGGPRGQAHHGPRGSGQLVKRHRRQPTYTIIFQGGKAPSLWPWKSHQHCKGTARFKLGDLGSGPSATL